MVSVSFGQSTILLEDFEDATVVYTTSITEFDDGGTDYFQRTTSPGGTFTGTLGSGLFEAQDIDGEGATLPATLNIDDIDISGYSSLILRVYLAEDDDGANQDWDVGDYVHITGEIDNGGAENLIWIENDGTTFNSAPLLDTDFDGTGDGTEITNAFVQFSASITGTGSLLDIVVEFNLDSGDEDIAIDNIEILGTKTIPNVIVSGDEGWRLLSLPITGGTVADVSDDTPVQGITGGTNSGFDSNFKIYDNTGSFEDPTNTSTAWGDGYGFALYFFNNTTAGSSTLPVTLDASGTAPSTDVGVTLNAGSANQFTLVGNPFASNYNTNSITATGGSISDNISSWNDGSSSYSALDRTTGYIVAPWQGFWVETADASVTSITIPTSGETTSSATGVFFSKATEQRGDISFTLTSEDSYDEAIRLAFRGYATEEFDRADATKLIPLAGSYSTMAFKSNDILKAVESLPYNLTEETTINMEQQLVGVSGEFTLDWSGLESIPANWGLTFHDYELGTNVDMRAETSYTFEATSENSEKVNPLSILTGAVAQAQKSKSDEDGIRFAITITPNATSVSNETGDDPIAFELEQNYPNPFNPSTTINYTVASTGKVTLNIYNLMGQKVAELVNATKTAGSYNVSWDASGAASGMYIYRLEAGGQTLTRKMTLIK